MSRSLKWYQRTVFAIAGEAANANATTNDAAKTFFDLIPSHILLFCKLWMRFALFGLGLENAVFKAHDLRTVFGRKRDENLLDVG